MSKHEVNKLEAKLADELGMNKCPQSGANIWKGDMRDDVFLVDLKSTVGKTQITVKRSDIEKLDGEAFDYVPSLIPAMLISINGFNRMVISVEDWKHYRELVRETRL